MNKSDLRVSFEIVGLLAVVASLLLLGYEVRQTRLAILGEVHQAWVLAASAADAAYADSPYMPLIDLKYENEGIDELTDEERMRLFGDANAIRQRAAGTYYMYELGLMDEEWMRTTWSTTVRQWKKRWNDLGMLSDGSVRPSFKAAVDDVGEPTSFVENATISRPE